jgi:hypothetical protein
MPVKCIGKQGVTTIDLGAVADNEIDLLSAVDASNVALATAPGGSTVHDDDVASASRPLALHTEHLSIQVEDQVVALAVRP